MIDWLKLDPKLLLGILLGLILSFAGQLVFAWYGLAPSVRDVHNLESRLVRIEVVLSYSGADSSAAIALFP